MLDEVSGADVAVEVKMTRVAFPGTILLAEGAGDALLFDNFVENAVCRIIPGNGRDSVLAAIDILEQEEFVGVVAIVDADFWHVTETDAGSNNVLITDSHDIEVMMLESKAFTHLVKEFGSKQKIQRFKEKYGINDLRKILFERALPIGILRFVSSDQDLWLTFKGIDYDKIVDRARVSPSKAVNNR
jgi:hypothetical protein